MSALKESYHDKNNYRDEAIARLRNKIDQLRHRKDQAYMDKLDGKIQDAYWLELSNRWQEEISTCEAELAAYGRADTPYYENGQKLLELAKNATALYLRGTAQEKNQILKLLHSNSRLIGGKLSPTL
ncbi:MAG: hypothetical protein A2048_00810 [Deltaproteobacteria bacterium GWA2_45_12]|nr:MAG: hypothetical protein A2048_00810 [Deltaproteobacteria bacterium GWA2_45_12]